MGEWGYPADYSIEEQAMAEEVRVGYFLGGSERA
jgi:hypothetical protein